MPEKYLFGPVPSRRLGISLGIDIVPYKTCSLNCVYCESGATTLLTAERREYVPAEKILNEADEFLKDNPKLDYITFSGAGEPTLNSEIGRIVRHLKSNYPQYKICLLTNGTLLGEEELTAELQGIDLVIPSLDATNEEEFSKINRPAPGISFEKLVEGLRKFREKSSCSFWLEVFITPGINDSAESLERFSRIIASIKPDKVQLNTLDRPGCEKWIKAAEPDKAEEFKAKLESGGIEVEIIGKFKAGTKAAGKLIEENELDSKIIELVTRRPCTPEDICAVLSADMQAVSHSLLKLKKAGKLRTETRERGCFYKI